MIDSFWPSMVAAVEVKSEPQYHTYNKPLLIMKYPMIGEATKDNEYI